MVTIISSYHPQRQLAAIPPGHPHRCHDSPHYRVFVSDGQPTNKCGLGFHREQHQGVFCVRLRWAAEKCPPRGITIVSLVVPQNNTGGVRFGFHIDRVRLVLSQPLGVHAGW
ncbi:hypothetical protein Tco_0992531 [Tanacetum coccineum]|uniref:Uncharacterized protein n=1 Tax=Tanacetum coccineum TaxID=301880 RepID=A0ABQ5F435_9ASTR